MTGIREVSRRLSSALQSANGKVGERPAPPFEPLRFAAVGVGYMGRMNVDAIAGCSETTLRAVIDPDGAAAEAVGRAHGVAHYAELTAALAVEKEVEAVFISVPHDLLAPLALQAAAAGRHVYVEKPGGVTVAEVDELVAECARRGVELTTNYWYRETPSFRLARSLVEEGAVGRVVGVESRLHQHKSLAYWAGNMAVPGGDWRSSRARSGGGLLMMPALHAVDYIRFVTGCEFARVYAEHGTLSTPTDVDDVFAMSYRLDNGAVGSLTTSSNMRGARLEELTVWGDRGTLRVSRPDLAVYSTRRNGLGRPGRWHRVRSRDIEGGPAVRRNLAAFARRVRTGSGAYVTPHDVRSTLAAAIGAYESLGQGRAVEPATEWRGA